MKIDFKYTDASVKDRVSEIEKLILSFAESFNIQEKESITVHTDNKTFAFYIECHVHSSDVIGKGTIDVPLDPENQPEYRANREVVEGNVAYVKMIEDAQNRRVFSGIVAEFNPDYESESPLKIIGGQHRYLAIEKALDKGVNEYHGFKIYFGLNTEQRLDVQLISNTNIAVASDLLDRMFETVKGPNLRNWCQECGLLATNQDFTDKKQRGSQISVRGARTLIMNYLKGKEIVDTEFDTQKTIPVFADTGGTDEEWEKIRDIPNLWKDPGLKKMGTEFSKLIVAQNNFFKNKPNSEFSEKAQSYSVIAAWAFTAGVLHKNGVRLQRHYDLSNTAGTDPLNAAMLAKGRHKTDAENYRGLGTRTDVKDRGRLVELFFLQAEKGIGITKQLVELAIQKFHAKEAVLKVKELENKL
jgi:hypothetical protein